ncbi:unnamed protein product, partial [Ectocarpus sp. 12 AP-2014]
VPSTNHNFQQEVELILREMVRRKKDFKRGGCGRELTCLSLRRPVVFKSLVWLGSVAFLRLFRMPLPEVAVDLSCLHTSCMHDRSFTLLPIASLINQQDFQPA